MNRRIVYFVEGEDEVTFINAMKEAGHIPPGSIRVFNIINKKLSSFERRFFKKDELAVFVFDTDVENTSILDDNITILNKDKRDKNLKDFKFLMQVRNLEDEILRSCNIHRIKEFFGNKSDSDFKSSMAQAKTLKTVLLRHNFDFTQIWRTRPDNCFEKYLANVFKL